MIRKQICVTEEQEQFLKNKSNEKGMAEAEIIRRALEDYMNPKEIKGFMIGEGT